MSLANRWRLENESLVSQQQPYCNHCVHHEEGLKCKAFDVIPDIILFRDTNHDKVIKGQNGDFIYEPTEKWKQKLANKDKQ